MTTERLCVLAGAAALGEFTAPQLAAYTGANAHTVRQVLRREQELHGFFTRQSPQASAGQGRAVVWRLDADQRAAILSEIDCEEAQAADLREAVSESLTADLPRSSRSERAAIFVASAEEVLVRSYSARDIDDRKTFGQIALNLLRAANAQGDEDHSDRAGIATEWWEQNPDVPVREQAASLDTVSRVSIESHLKTVQRTPGALPDEKLLALRAHRVAAFAALAMRLAEGLPLTSNDLMDAAEAISKGSADLPVPQTLSWMKIFVEASIASGNPPPLAILAKPEQSPEKLFPISRGVWQQVIPPVEIASRGYSIWVESWAEALLLDSLIPGVVVAHDDSAESNETLSHVMPQAAAMSIGRAVVVASTARDIQAVARVSRQGGIFYPILQTAEGLLATVTQAVAQVMSSSPELDVSYFVARNISSSGFDAPGAVGALLEISRAVSGEVIASSDLELAQRTLAVLEQAVHHYHQDPMQDNAMVAELLDRLVDALSELGDSSHALSVTEEALGRYRRIIQYRHFQVHRRAAGRSRGRRLSEAELRTEVRQDMAWAYNDIAGDEDERAALPPPDGEPA